MKAKDGVKNTRNYSFNQFLTREFDALKIFLTFSRLQSWLHMQSRIYTCFVHQQKKGKTPMHTVVQQKSMPVECGVVPIDVFTFPSPTLFWPYRPWVPHSVCPRLTLSLVRGSLLPGVLPSFLPLRGTLQAVSVLSSATIHNKLCTSHWLSPTYSPFHIVLESFLGGISSLVYLGEIWRKNQNFKIRC